MPPTVTPTVQTVQFGLSISRRAPRSPAAGAVGMRMAIDPVLVVGGGPAGLAAAAALHRRGIPALVLEKSDAVGASWRRHYERLHLHTTRHLSRLRRHAVPAPVRPVGGARGRRGVPRAVRRAPPPARADGRRGHPDLARRRRPVAARHERGRAERPRGRRRDRLQPHARAAGVARATFDGEVVHASAYRNATPYARPRRARRRRRQHRRRDRGGPDRGRRRRGSGSPCGRRRTSSAGPTSAGPRRAPASWCGTCPCGWST